MVKSTPKALNELLDLEEFLREKIARLKESGDEARSPFVRALGEVQALLSLGLKGVMRRQIPPRSESSNAPQVRTGITRRRPQRSPSQSDCRPVDGEFVLEYRQEVAALALESTEPSSVTSPSGSAKFRLKTTTIDR